MSDNLSPDGKRWRAEQLAARRAEQERERRVHSDPVDHRYGVNDDPDDPGPAEQPDPHEVAAENHSGQVRMAYRLAHTHRDGLLHVHNIGWHYWDGKRWADDDIGAARRAVLDVLRTALAGSLGDKELRLDVRRCESGSGIAGVLAIAAALKPFAATVRDLDADPHLLNCANGTLDLRTIQLSEHKPRDRITKICNAAYTDNTDNGAWHNFLHRVLPDQDVRNYLQRLTGVALLGKVTEHLLPIWTGAGANGKSTGYKAILHALGDYASTAEPDLFMHRAGAHPTGEMDLRGRRLVVVSESDRDRQLAESTMKRLTGGDPIKARRMRQDFLEFEPSHMPVLITNHLPVVSGDDESVWRRIRVIPFNEVIPTDERDPDLDAKLAADADAILAWAVTGWIDYIEHGLNEPAGVLFATENYRFDSDAIARFFDDMCAFSPAVMATTKDLFAAWQKWSAAEGIPEMTQRAFGKALDTHGYPVVTRTGRGRWRPGIAVKDDEQ